MTPIVAILLFLATVAASAQTVSAVPDPLDPTRSLAYPPPAEPHTVLPEQYVWTADDITALRQDHAKFPWNRPELRSAPHLFRSHFHLAAVPPHATLYLAGPRHAEVFLNGRAVATFTSNPDAPIGFQVFHADLTSVLKAGENLLAISAVRGRGIVAGAGPEATQQLAYGEVLAAKIVSDSETLLISDTSWRSTATVSRSWESPAFNDGTWQTVATLGPVESNVDFFQWNADAGMYGWPGYSGLSAPLRTYALPATAATHIFPSQAAFAPVAALTSGAPFTVTLAPATATDAEAPSLLLDFGREVAGRLLVESGSSAPITLAIAYGESEVEAEATGLTPGQQGGNYLGTNRLEVLPHATARGPKSAFRFVRIQFLRGPAEAAVRSIRLEGIYYPVPQKGSFTSSDPVLNRVWETGAYTAHLCMQDGLWDAPKRDRGRWVGDIDVEGRVLATAFGDATLTEDTLRRLAEATPAGQHVNGIPSYTALWLTSLQTLYQHTGDGAFVESQHAAIVRFVERLDRDLGPNHLIAPGGKDWHFVDWAPGMYGQTREARVGTELQYVRGYRAAASLLQALGDAQTAAGYLKRASEIKGALNRQFDPTHLTLGGTWQLNALSVISLGGQPEGAGIWPDVLAHVKQDSPTDQSISPYFGAYLLDAFSELHHPEAALEWIRAYWGGMLAQGATSFWESYDLRWPKGPNFALSLQADGTSGSFVSLAHGWSSGPTAWLTENILGVTPAAPGYSSVAIAPQLLDLTYARGTVPTPHGVISVAVERTGGAETIAVDLPPGIAQAVVTPVPLSGTRLYLDGVATDTPTALISGAGHHVVVQK